MRSFSFIKEKILQYLDYKGITKYKFYQETGITNGILSQSNGFSEENILKFLNVYKDISLDWLFFGTEPMIKTDTTKEQSGNCQSCADKERIIEALKSTISTQDTLIKVLMQGNKTQQNENQ